VGDTEPFPALSKQLGSRQDYRRWLKAFRLSTGIPLSFLIMDINWLEDGGRWAPAVKDAAELARTLHLSLGSIYDASFEEGAKKDEEWLSSAVENFTHIEGDLKVVPDKVLFESWGESPHRSITDIFGPGEDCLVSQYLRFHRIAAK